MSSLSDSSWLLGAALGAMLVASGCGSKTSDPAPGSDGLVVTNPSGTCKASGNGSRAGYHSSADSVWLPDCQNPLAREYWRVFAQSEQSAYVIPRPDGAPEFAPVCSNPAHELRTLADRYSLCRAADSPAAVERVNDIAPSDAFVLTRFLHTRLRFTSVEGGSGITPYALPSDIIDACALHTTNSDALESICERERERLQSGDDIGFSYTGPGAVELTERLNELYGIR